MKRFFAVLILIAAIAGAWWYARGGRWPSPQALEQAVEQAAEKAVDAVQEVKKEISAPPPIRAERESPSAFLTRDGIFQWTNVQRRDNGGLPALTMNAQLNAAAAAKVKDMFAKQYFEHVSPAGIGPGDLAEQSGYAYISVGENLALGNFENDRAVVQAWMDSPGHRANILNASYAEIGIAVGRGVFDGKTTWIAVQEFGRPLSECPQPDRTLQAQIDADKNRLEELKVLADEKRAELEASKKPRTREQVDAYNAKVNEYNALADQINVLIKQIQGEITVYNGQVQAWNACAAG